MTSAFNYPTCPRNIAVWMSIKMVRYVHAKKMNMGNYTLNASPLTPWGRVMHICVNKLNHHWSRYKLVLAPTRRQAIIWTSAGILLTGPLVTNFIAILFKIHILSFKKINFKNVWKVAAILSRPQCVRILIMICTNEFYSFPLTNQSPKTAHK